jgi:hypothetical protein
VGPIKNNKITRTTQKSRNNRAVNSCHVHWVFGSHCLINDALAISQIIPPGIKKIVVRDGVKIWEEAVVNLFQNTIQSHLQQLRKQKKTGRNKAAMEGLLCTEDRKWDHRIRSRSANHYTASFVTWLLVQSYRSKGHRPPVQPYSTQLVFGRRYEV